MARAPAPFERWATTATEALSEGASRRSMLSSEWNVAGNCEQPVWRAYDGSRYEDHTKHGAKQRAVGPEHRLELWVRCRKCLPCRKAKSWMWTQLALKEMLAARRTWFGTLTVSADNHVLNDARVRRRLAERCVSWDELSDDQRFRHRVDGLKPEITKAWKRLRKNTGAKVRYLLVAEVHRGGGANDGYPHWHCLIHEYDTPVTKRQLEREFRQLGNTNFKLAPMSAARYVCKYLTKDASARVRASQRYGDVSPHHLHDSENVIPVRKDVTPHEQSEED